MDPIPHFSMGLSFWLLMPKTATFNGKQRPQDNAEHNAERRHLKVAHTSLLQSDVMCQIFYNLVLRIKPFFNLTEHQTHKIGGSL